VSGVLDRRVAAGTANFTIAPAMSEAEAVRSLEIGRELAAEASRSSDMAALGEMGIGNTTTAAAVLCACTGAEPEDVVGAGTGADDTILARKVDAVRRALRLHAPPPADGMAVLRTVGGFEMGGTAGFLIEASKRRLPVVLDGFPCCAGALIARAIDPTALDSAFFGHRSAERGHARMLEALGAEPVCDFAMRLGEGSGAAVAIGIIETAVRLYREMATFAEAGVAGRLV
jgi:nicotinate-nucleotide--dimethylbenzimidazole phosphoribosyltransferase